MASATATTALRIGTSVRRASAMAGAAPRAMSAIRAGHLSARPPSRSSADVATGTTSSKRGVHERRLATSEKDETTSALPDALKLGTRPLAEGRNLVNGR